MGQVVNGGMTVSGGYSVGYDSYYVATNGNDSWSGRLKDPNAGLTDGPFATLERARQAVRTNPLISHVTVRGGTYFVSDNIPCPAGGPIAFSICFESLDSGSLGSPVFYSAFPGEVPIFGGGNTLAGLLSPTLTGVTANNTPSCTSNGVPHAGCNLGFAGLSTLPANTGAQTAVIDPAPTNVSTVSLHNYIYAGWNGRMICHYMPWFSNITPFNGHMNIGMNENSAITANSQVTNMIQRGCDVVNVDWKGTGSAQAFALASTLAVFTETATRTSYPLKFMVTLDQAALLALTPLCPTGATDQTACLSSAINGQLDYIRDNYAGNPAYEKDATGKPLVMFFIDESAWSGSNWASIMGAVRAHVNLYPAPFKLFKEFGNFTETGFDGAFAWPQPPAWSSTNQLCWDSPTCGASYLDTFYNAAQSTPSRTPIGVIYKGFDDSRASFGTNRVIAQRCGQVLQLAAAKITSAGYGTSQQLPYVQLSTWNDYEEGTEAETGVDNCFTLSASISTNTLTWVLANSDATYSNTNTIDHFAIWYGPSTSALKLAKDNIPVGTLSQNIQTLIPPGTTNVYVQMVGKGLIINRMSNASAYSAGTSQGPLQYQDDGLTTCYDVVGATFPCRQFHLTMAGAGVNTEFEAMFYKVNGASDFMRRMRPRIAATSTGYNYLDGPQFCQTGATQAEASVNCGCPTANACAFQSNPCGPSAPWKCFNRARFQNTDVQGGLHFVYGATQFIMFEKWTVSRMRMTGVNVSTKSVDFSGPASLSDGNSGPLPNHRYIVENCAPVGVSPDGNCLKPQHGFFLDTCPTTAHCVIPETNWTLYLWTDPNLGENPLSDTIVVPQGSNFAKFIGLQNAVFNGLTFSFDNWKVPDVGLGELQGMPSVPAMVSCVDCVNVNFNGGKFTHSQGWGLEFVGASHNNNVQNSQLTDLGAGGVRIGRVPAVSDVATSVPHHNLVFNTLVKSIGRYDPSGIGPGVWIGNAYINLVSHVEVADTYSGGMANGNGLNRSTNKGCGGNGCNAGNVFEYFNIYDVGQGVTMDFGGIYDASSLSPLCPTQGQPTLVPDTYCTHIRNGIIHDVYHAVPNGQETDGYGGECIYLDQGASAVLVQGNLVYRCTESAFINGFSDRANDNFTQFNLFDNNIVAFAGSTKSNTRSVINRRGENPNSFSFTHNVVITAGASTPPCIGNSPTVQNCGHWSPVDCADNPVAASSRFFFDRNIYYDVTGRPLDFLTSVPNAGTIQCVPPVGTGQYTYTHRDLASWQSIGEDVNSINVNPLFVAPGCSYTTWYSCMTSFGQDDYHFQALSPCAGITCPTGTAPLDAMARAGLLVPVSVPYPNPSWPLILADACADFGGTTCQTGVLPNPNPQVSQTSIAQLPQHWVDPHQCDATLNSPDVVKTVKNSGGNYAGTIAGFQAAIADAEALRVSTGLSTKIVVDVDVAVTVLGDPTQPVLPNSGYTGTKCITIVSSNPLRRGVQVGSVPLKTAFRQTNVVNAETLDPHGLTTGNHAVVENLLGGTTDFNVSQDEGGALVTVTDATHFTYPQTGADESATVTFPFSQIRGPNTLAQQAVTTPRFYKIIIQGANTSAFQTAAGAHHWDLRDFEISTTAAQNDSPLVLEGFQGATVRSDQGFHMGISQFYIHGCLTGVPTTIPIFPQPITGGCVSDSAVKNGVRFLCSDCWELDGMIDQIAYAGVDSHASGTFAAAGPIRIDNVHMRGGSTTLHFGGTPPTIDRLVPTDIEARHLILELDPNWKAITGCDVVGGKGWAIKNRLEFKNAQNVVFSGNKVNYSWCDGQVGSIFLMTVRGNGAWSEDTNITVEDNLWRHALDFMQVLGRDNGASGSGPSMPVSHILISNNLVIDIENNLWSEGAANTHIVPMGGASDDYSCTASRAGNVMTLNPCTCLEASCPWTGLASGDFVHLTACTDPSFNMTRGVALSSDRFSTGPITVAQTGPNVAGPVTCNLNNGQGHPSYFTVDHLTAYGLANEGPGLRHLFTNTANTGTDPESNVPRFITYKNSLIARNNTVAANWVFCSACPSNKEGSGLTKAMQAWDTTTLGFHHLAFFGLSTPLTSLYSEWNPVGVESTTPLSVAIKGSPTCGGTPTAACAGFILDAVQADNANYHNFRLAPTSFYHAGNAGQSDDAKDLGTDIPRLDNSFVKDPYVCTSYCGTNGPYPK